MEVNHFQFPLAKLQSWKINIIQILITSSPGYKENKQCFDQKNLTEKCEAERLSLKQT